MKEIKYAFTALAALAIASCSDIIDKEPVLEKSPTTIFASKEKIEANLEGVYGSLGSIAPSYFYTTEMRGDDFEDLVQNGNLIAYEMNVSVSGSSSPWNSLYQAIGEANDFINNLENAKDIVGNNYGQYRAEALFVRALSYYWLTVLYARTYHLNPNANAVPLRLGTPETSGNDLAPSTIEEVHKQILDDLSDANIALLPVKGSSPTLATITHATQGAAHALRQRLYLERWDWDKAIAEGKAITGYKLGDITSIFAAPYYTDESIFSFPYSVNNKNSMASSFYLANSVALEDVYSGIFALPIYSQEADVRKSKLTRKPNSHITIAKYVDTSSGTDWLPVFRYGEVLLNLSEAYFNKGDETTAKSLLLEVRRRSIAAADDILDETTLKGETLKEAIYNERRLELVGEGVRSIDIHRRGDTFWKRHGGNEIKVGPTEDGYIYPIPLSETLQNSLIKSDN